MRSVFCHDAKFYVDRHQHEDLLARVRGKKRKNAAAHSVIAALSKLRPLAIREYFNSYELEEDVNENQEDKE